MEQFEDHDTDTKNSRFLMVDHRVSPDSRHQARGFPLTTTRPRPETDSMRSFGSPRGGRIILMMTIMYNADGL